MLPGLAICGTWGPEDNTQPHQQTLPGGARAETRQKGPGHSAVMFLVNTREYLKGMNEVAPQRPRTAAPLRGGRIPPSSSSFFLKNFLFIYFWLCWVFVAVHGLSLVVVSGVSGGCSSLPCVGCSLWWLLWLQSMSF